MLRNIKLSVDVAYIDPGSTLTHTGTSYQVSDTPDFNGALVVNVVNDTVNLLEYRFTHNMNESAPLYVRTKYHYTNLGVLTESNWSNAISLNSNQIGFKSSSTIIATPSITISFDYSNTVAGEIVVTLDNILRYAGVGTIVSTSWLLETTDGVVLFDLPKSVDIKSVLRLPITQLGGATTVVATAVIHTDNNASSNAARAVGSIDNTVPSFFNAVIKGTLYTNYNNYAEVSGYSSEPSTVDIRITQLDGTVINSYIGLDPYAPLFVTGNLLTTSIYIVELMVTFKNEAPTAWIEIFRGYPKDYNIRSYINAGTYDTANMNFAGYLNFPGLSAQTINADEDNVFYLAIPETDILEAYVINSSSIYQIGKQLILPVDTLTKIPTLNYIRLYNGQILLDYAVYNASGATNVTRFELYNYNHVTKALTSVHSYDRTDERFGTGMSSGAVPTMDGLVYYVPGEIFDVNGLATPLEMRVYDITTNTIIDSFPLPVLDLIHDVSITSDQNGDIYLIGGSTEDTVIDKEILINSNMYKLDKIAKTWTLVTAIAYINSTSYRYSLRTLNNGSLFIADTTPNSTGTTGDKYNYLYDIATQSLTSVISKPATEQIGITIELKDGDMVTITSRPDPVEAASILRSSISTVIVDNTAVGAAQAVTDLIVNPGETVYLRDPNRYNTITINGTSPVNTGKVIHINDNNVITYIYNDLLIPKNTTIAANLVDGVVYNRVVVFGYATLTTTP